MNLGQKIRETRESKSISLRKLAKEIGVSPSFISQVEQSKAQPSVDSLKKIANILEVSCSYLIGEDSGNPDVEVRVKGHNKFDTERLSNITLKKLVPDNIENNLEPSLLNLSPGSGSQGDFATDGGEEFLLLLSGELDITLNGKTYTMHEGDNIYFNSSVKHSFKNNSQKNTKVLWVKAST